ncbi:cysteine protease [Paraoerskovia sediminicola]|uniref:Cysteine protease n=1 Tax=Paraoerskovia sediminicola TaxID=1138587 RepID=A0ABM8FZU8_9CELL|nr:cysteine protease [Paraoerskovia sediminicola]
MAWVGAVRRWPTVSVAAATIVGYLLVGGAVAFPSTTVGGVVPTLTTLRELSLGAVTVWKDGLTNVPPLASFPDLRLLPFLVMLLGGVVTATVAWRARYAAWAVVTATATLVAATLFGTVEAAFPLAQGLVIAVVGLLWAAWRTTEERMSARAEVSGAAIEASRRLRWYRLRTGVLLLVLAGVVSAALVPVLAPAQRSALREVVVPPLDLHKYVSPLVGFRSYVKDEADTELFTVDGLPEQARVRLATLDSYDGVVYDVSTGEPGSGVYSRAGERIASSASGTPATIDVTIGDYDGVWVPDVGDLTGVTYSGPRDEDLAGSTYYNAETGTTLATAGLVPGDSYRMEVLVPDVPSEEEAAAAGVEQRELPEATDVPDSVGGKGAQFMGSATDLAQRVTNIRDALVAGGILSHGLENQQPSRPGHFAQRIDTLLAEDEMIGDDEQFAVAFALMAQQAGIPARVVMGFVPDEEWEPGTPYVATGRDVRAWAEVPYAGYGWVPVDVVPDEDNKVQPEPESAQVPKPPVLDDPEPPEEPEPQEAGTTDAEDDEDPAQSDPFDWARAALFTAAIGIPLLLLVAPFALLAGYKARRSARRRTAARAEDRFSGGWSEVLDTATDLGQPVAQGATRSEGAAAITGAFSRVPEGSVGQLATSADRNVFGGAVVDPAEAEGYWTDVAAVVGGMRASVSARRRWRARFSLRSLPSWGLAERFRRLRPAGRRNRTPGADDEESR